MDVLVLVRVWWIRGQFWAGLTWGKIAEAYCWYGDEAEVDRVEKAPAFPYREHGGTQTQVTS